MNNLGGHVTSEFKNCTRLFSAKNPYKKELLHFYDLGDDLFFGVFSSGKGAQLFPYINCYTKYNSAFSKYVETGDLSVFKKYDEYRRARIIISSPRAPISIC